jgi:RNA polymerase sigma-70 factor (ECF subfamily)
LHAFERELLSLLPRLRRFARSLARDGADADDLTQLTLERALKARQQWAAGTRMDAWVMRIMRNCWLDEGRSRTRRDRVFAAADGEQVEHADPLADAADRSADADRIDRAMSRLPSEQREVVALVLVEGFKYREAADLLEIPIGTLTSRLNRGRQALTQMLGDTA